MLIIVTGKIIYPCQSIACYVYVWFLMWKLETWFSMPFIEYMCSYSLNSVCSVSHITTFLSKKKVSRITSMGVPPSYLVIDMVFLISGVKLLIVSRSLLLFVFGILNTSQRISCMFDEFCLLCCATFFLWYLRIVV